MIVAQNVTKYYGAHAAVWDLNFSIEEGEVVGLLGLNGAGKTTTLFILSSLLVPTSGQVLMDGLDLVQDAQKVRARLGFLPETPPLYPEMQVSDYLKWVAHLKNMPSRSIPQALQDALVATDLVDVQSERIATLSYGYQRRIGIAQAIIHRPSLILMDEPTSGLDPKQVQHMRQLIRNLRGQNTLVVSSHILSEIHELCDRILVLQGGRIVASGSEEDLAAHMSQTTMVSVEVRAEPGTLERTLTQAAQALWLARCTVEGHREGVTHATVELHHDRRELLAQTLVQAGLGLRRLERTRLELEAIFLMLTADASPDRQGDPTVSEVQA